MARIVSLHAERRGGYRRAGRTTRKGDAGQMDLFAGASIHRLQTGLSPFDEALLLDRRSHEGAARAYERAAGSGDRPADAWCNRGILAADPVEAIEWFSRALIADPMHAEAHYNLGCLYLDHESFGPARVHLGIAAARHPDEPEVLFNLAVAFAGLGRIADAASTLRRYRKVFAGADEAADRLLEELERVLSAG